MRPLGSHQRSALNALLRHGQYPGRWIYGTYSRTERLLAGLVARGLATVTEPQAGPYRRVWTLTEAGRGVAQAEVLDRLRPATPNDSI